MDHFAALLGVTPNQALVLVGIVFAAGVVRGFAGFALSALVMSSAVVILPPVALIPICWILEMAASILMVRGGWQDADRRVAIGLVIGSALGMPLGLALTIYVAATTSKTIALVLIITLALSQLFRLRSAFLATQKGLWTAGLTAGIATGLASVGGMVVALYVMSQNAPARTMRATLVLFLFLGSATSLITLLISGVMDSTAFVRGLSLAVPAMLGVSMGSLLFRPAWEKYYRPFCLYLLVGLCIASLARIAW